MVDVFSLRISKKKELESMAVHQSHLPVPALHPGAPQRRVPPVGSNMERAPGKNLDLLCWSLPRLRPGLALREPLQDQGNYLTDGKFSSDHRQGGIRRT